MKILELEFLYSSMKGIYHHKNGQFTLKYSRSPDTICFFPITWNQDYFFFGETKSGENCDEPHERTILHTVDKKFQPVSIDSLDNSRDIHQCCYRDGLLYICNTAYNKLDIYDPIKKKLVNTIERGEQRKDIHHINGVWINQGKIYTTFLKKRQSYQSDIIVYDRQTLKLIEIIDVGSGLHNVYVRGNLLYTCSTWSKEFLCYNLETKEKKTYKFDNKDWFWLRGLASPDGKHFLTTGSTIAPHEKRHTIKRNKFYLFNAEAQLVDELVFTESDCGPLYDVRLLGNDVCS